MSYPKINSHADLADLKPVFARIRERAGIQDGYSKAAFFEAVNGGGEADPAHVPDDRTDRTHLALATIDPAGSRDLDQAVAIDRHSGGHVVHYAIADVGAHVVPGSALDADTRQRVETVYCPDHRIGLHPPVLSEGYASLLPGERRKAVLWTLHVGADGELGTIEVERAWVRSRAQYSYEQLHHSPPPGSTELVAMLREVGKRRRALMRSRGAVTLPRPSQEVESSDGKLRLEFRLGLPIEDDNAQISLMTGEAAARLMLKAGLGILRTMPPASAGAIRRLRRQAHALGVEWSEDASYADLLATMDSHAPENAAFLTEAISLFRGARWEAFDDSDTHLTRPPTLTHGALGVPYAHVTAPLRRLVDRYGLEVCLAAAANRNIPEWARAALPWIGEEMARGVRVNRKVDRACIDAVEAAILADAVGQEFTGVGLDEDTVQLRSPAVVARCSGGVTPGVVQRVTLVSARLDDGPRFRVTAPSAS